jgi:phosphohistidine phosphatase
MVNLVIMRHGEAVAQSSQDSERQLNTRGEAEVNLMAQWLSQVYPPFDYVLASPYLRTQQTANLMLTQQSDATQFHTLTELVPDGDCQQVQLYVDALFSQNPDARILIVSHMPLVSFLVETFTKSGNTPIFDTAALVCIEYHAGRAGSLLEKLAPAELHLRAT